MKTMCRTIFLAASLSLLAASTLPADTHYVSSGNVHPMAPYTNWTTAARRISDALAVAQSNDVVLVTNGVYTGGFGISPERTLRSVNGPQHTVIDAGATPLSYATCVYPDRQALLSGFTLTGGAGELVGAVYGDPSLSEDEAAVVTNCVIVGNWGQEFAGGAYCVTLYDCILADNRGGACGCTLYNCVLTNNWDWGGAGWCTLYGCTLTGNSAASGGGAADCTLYNCTLTGNSATSGGGTGGAAGCALYNCIVYGNTAQSERANYDSASTLDYCCTIPLPSDGVGNLALDPQLASLSHLSASSPCRGAGSAAFATGSDFDGEPWANPPSIGCDEFQPGAVTGPLTVGLRTDYVYLAPGYAMSLMAQIEGRTTRSLWDFGDGTTATNQPIITHAWATPGDYRVALWAFNETYPEGVCATLTIHVGQSVHFVDAANANPAWPFTSWTSAATNLQDAVDAAGPGSVVWVTNGLYAVGARAATPSAEPSRVLVDKPLTLHSVNGSTFTLIDGGGEMRCAYLAHGAVLSGFTLTNGTSAEDGGGVWCDASAVVSNCLVVGNSAVGDGPFCEGSGGGAYGGTLYNCTLTGNVAPFWHGRNASHASYGGGACASILYYCTLTGNWAEYGGGACDSTLYHCTVMGNDRSGAWESTLHNCAVTGNDGIGACESTLYNCTVMDNDADGAQESTLYNCTVTRNSSGVAGSTLFNSLVYYNLQGNYDKNTVFNYCCTTPLPAGPGNLDQEPQFARASHLSAGSPCIGRGNATYASSVDLDGEPWANPPSIGCDEYRAGSLTGPIELSVVAAYTNVSVGFRVDFQAVITGAVSASRWDFGDGTVVSNRPWLSHAWTAAGDYVVELRAYNESHPAGVAVTVTVQVVREEHYVAVDSLTPVAPYASWASAARTIQEAVDAISQPGAVVWVSNGVYQAGQRAVYGMSNRLAVTQPVTVRSVNGPAVTRIVGYQAPGTTNGPAAVRCVYLTNAAVLAGFTLSDGATQASGDSQKNQSGGGVWCEGSSAVVTNCVLMGNSAGNSGGAAFGGTLNRCTLATNSAGNGGGASSARLNHCVLTGNSAATNGGGVAHATLNTCVLTGNSAKSNGGGAYAGTLSNCTLTGNSAEDGGGASGGTLNNCILYYNSARHGSANYSGCTLSYCCATPLPAGPGNLDQEPQLATVARLSASSPCIGRGSPTYASGVDLDGEPWANPPSIGCDEYRAGPLTGPLEVSIVAACTNVSVGFGVDFQAVITGLLSASRWDFGDGNEVSNRPWASHAWTAAGDYVVELRAYNDSYPAGLAATVTVHVVQAEHYVAVDSVSPLAPYTSWATAARSIQEALDAVSQPGAVVWVSNGVYQAGARAVHGNNRVAVTKPVTVRSVNGPEVTRIVGYRVPGTTNGPMAVRCVYLAEGAVLAGFALANGATQTSGDLEECNMGGGVYCEGPGALVTNCVLTGNSAFDRGGGAYRGTLNHCSFTANSAYSGGGASGSTLNDCTLTGNSASGGAGGGANNSTLNHCTLTANSAHNYGGGANDSTLNHCTLTGNSAWYGGGVWCGTLTNCALTGNSASVGGGGACGGTLNNCALTSNSAASGGGASGATLNNCTLSGNSAEYGGGASGGMLNNCIIYYNSARREGANYRGGTLNYCCTTPLPAGPGNLDQEPQLAKVAHLNANSPCIGRGNPAYASGVDLEGDPWANPPSIGCEEYWAGSLTGPVEVSIVAAYTNVSVGFGVEFQAMIAGAVSASCWDFGDGSVASNRPWAAHAWTAAGDYVVELRAYNDSYPSGVAATVTVHVVRAEHYVAVDSVSPLAPYTSWATAARSIQEVLDSVSQPGAVVWVSNGVYQAGGRTVYGNNRVAVTQPVTVRSVNGPAVTRIVGYQVPGTTNGLSAVRCVYMAPGAVLAGFTLTNGATQTSGDWDKNQSGGGVWCEGSSAVVSNCVLTGNAAYGTGGGSCGGTLNGCMLTGNSASGGGGSSGGTLNGCVLTGNSASSDGGGAFGGTLNSCTLAGNTGQNGGGAYGSTLNHCTLAGNSAGWYAGGGAFSSALNHCIIYYNDAPAEGANYHDSTLNYCCTTPRPAGSGNVAGPPLFADTNGWSNLRLQANSPCINAGNNAFVSGDTDLDGNPRIAGATVDIGAYEFQGEGLSGFPAWLWQYGQRIDGSANAADPDHDCLNNQQEWVCATCPTNSQSALRLLSPAPSGNGLRVTWQSAAGVNYCLERTTNLTSPFTLLASNIVGQADVTVYEDTCSTGAGPFLYRVGASQR